MVPAERRAPAEGCRAPGVGAPLRPSEARAPLFAGVIVDDLYTNEWMFIPHFYYNMYVFQYATSVTAGTALFGKILEDQQAGSDNYKDLLRAGGSDYPHELLKRAGVDLSQPEPYRAVVTQMNAVMDQMEKLLEERDQ